MPTCRLKRVLSAIIEIDELGRVEENISRSMDAVLDGTGDLVKCNILALRRFYSANFVHPTEEG